MISKAHAALQSEDRCTTERELPAELFRAAFDHAADGLVIMNRHRQILYMNAAAARLTGVNDAIGQYCGALFRCHDDTRPELCLDGCFGQCVLLTHEAMQNVEMRIVSVDGKTVPVAVTYSYIPASDGEHYLLMSLRDISDRKRLEHETQQKEALHYTLQERERLARDLHDGVVQDLAYANMQLKMLCDDASSAPDGLLQQLQHISSVLEQSFVALREAIYDLTFRAGDDLVKFVEKYLGEFALRSGIAVEFKPQDVPKRIEPYVNNQIAKVLQEALANVRKHADAKHVEVTLQYDRTRRVLKVVIADDGRGFDVTAAQSDSNGHHYGMKTMRERCELIGAQLAVESQPGQGTKITIEVPVA